ncbi:hypothetical protein DL95DRAFT_465634 [Leptodontidium sp. 2 PMI_412]|nr:hypothetical protein DL95DRAFT_465634 [Leptodontidium sp. 2 PMI_412]
MREWEIVMSSNLIFECNFQKDAIQKYFSFGVVHTAQVIKKRAGWVRLAVTQKLNPKVPPPSVEHARFKVRLHNPMAIAQDVATAEAALAEVGQQPPKDKGKGKEKASDFTEDDRIASDPAAPILEEPKEQIAGGESSTAAASKIPVAQESEDEQMEEVPDVQEGVQDEAMAVDDWDDSEEDLELGDALEGEAAYHR